VFECAFGESFFKTKASSGAIIILLLPKNYISLAKILVTKVFLYSPF